MKLKLTLESTDENTIQTLDSYLNYFDFKRQYTFDTSVVELFIKEKFRLKPPIIDIFIKKFSSECKTFRHPF